MKTRKYVQKTENSSVDSSRLKTDWLSRENLFAHPWPYAEIGEPMDMKEWMIICAAFPKTNNGKRSVQIGKVDNWILYQATWWN